MTDEEISRRKEWSNVYRNLNERIGHGRIHANNLFKIIKQELGIVSDILHNNEIYNNNEELNRLRKNIEVSLEAYRLEIAKNLDEKQKEANTLEKKYRF